MSKNIENFQTYFPFCKKVFVQAVLTVVVIKVSPLYFRFSNSIVYWHNLVISLKVL